ncbi:hypothetical protein BGX21_009491 [Mortierella sp. AD011]|nr:hypothetical protein BGX20_000784 [Mortierella sp. AD010]KAF9396520.1 hypothetical protein BGX21_009491 [Mortierella sp. AD011]
MPSHSLKTLFKGHAPSTQPSDNRTVVNNSHSNSHSHSAGTYKHTTPPEEQHHNGASIAQDTHGAKASDYKLNSTPGPRKRSIILDMMLPPEAPPVDAKLALPPVILFPSSLEPEGSIMTVIDREIKPNEIATVSESTSTTSESTSTSRSLRSWIRNGGSNNTGVLAASEEGGRIMKRNKPKSNHEQDNTGSGKGVADSETTSYTSKTTFVRTWISKITRTESQEKPSPKAQAGNAAETMGHKASQEIGVLRTGAEKQLVGQTEAQPQQFATKPTSLHSNSEGSVTTVQQQEIIHQEINQKTRNVALVNVNISVQDIFGLGKVMEVTLAMLHAHGAFLRRHPFWLQCVLMSWEGLVVLLLVWGVLRVVGLAEVIVWGADDLVRGTLTTLQIASRTVYRYLSL